MPWINLIKVIDNLDFNVNTVFSKTFDNYCAKGLRLSSPSSR